MDYSVFSPRPGVSIAYVKTPATSGTLPGVVFMGGFRSDMTGTKATFLEARCRARGQAYVRFDYTGHGKSSGAFTNCTIGGWKQDALDVIDHLTEGPQIIVGSSMGGWIGLLAALARQPRIAGYIGLAAAPDFTEDIYHKEFSEEQRRHLRKTGMLYLDNAYGDPYPLTLGLFKEAKSHLLLKNTIPLHCPVRLIHGKKDADVPWEKSQETADKLASGDVRVIFIDEGDHRLSEPDNLEIIDEALAELSRKHHLKKMTEI